MLCAEDIRQFLDIFPALGYFMFLLGFVMIFIMPPLAPSGLEFLTVSAFASVYISVCFRQRDFSRFLSFFFRRSSVDSFPLSLPRMCQFIFLSNRYFTTLVSFIIFYRGIFVILFLV
jgi:hypothetical protein